MKILLDYLTYEVAILQSKLKNVPIVPIYMSTEDEEFSLTKAKTQLPDLPHARNSEVQGEMDEFAYAYNLIHLF